MRPVIARVVSVARTILLCAAVGIACGTASQAATSFPPYGGPGGSEFRRDCPPGEYLIGASFRFLTVLNSLTIFCAPVDSSGLTGQHTLAPLAGGSGGLFWNRLLCHPGHVVSGAGILLKHDAPYVQMMDLSCKATTSNASYTLANVGAPASVFPDERQDCPRGEAVVGIHGRSGEVIDAIGFICDVIDDHNASEPEPVSEACVGVEGDRVPGQWKDMLDVHNERRAQHCVAPLKWSAELAEAAQAYAEQCILDMHGATGENMADAFRYDASGDILPALTDREAFEKTWYCEVNNYDFNNPSYVGGFTAGCRDVNGHFMQVVWKDTCELGCGRATCEMTDRNGNVHQGTHWVCRYRPPGNVNVDNQSVLLDQVKPPLCVGKGGG